MGLYFDQFVVGQIFKTIGRTITESDIVNYAGLSGDFNPIHVDRQFAEHNGFGQRVAHGMLVITAVTGLIHQLNIIDDTTVALLEWQQIKFFKPVFIGDTIQANVQVLQKKETSKPDKGMIQLGLSVSKQDRTEVIHADMLILIRR